MRLVNRLNNNYPLGAPPDYALEFNGTDEYLQIALPNNELLASAGTADFYSSGSAIAGWIAGDDVVWNGTETGKTYTNTITIPADNTLSKTISGLIVGKKYKLKLRYQAASIDGFTIGSNDGTYFTLMQSSGEWNTVSKIFIALDTTIIFIAPASGDVILDYASVKCDQGFDLNKDQEMILHSKNWDFEGSTTDWAGTGNHSVSLSTLDKSGTGATNTQSLLISASGAGDSGTNHIKLPSANLESCVSGKKYTIQGEARLDASSLTYGSNIIPSASSDFATDGTGYWWTTNATKSWVNVGGDDNCVKITSTAASGYFRLDKLDVSSNNKKITFRARSQNGFTGKLDYGWAGTPVIFPTINPNLTASWQNYEVYISSGISHYIISFLSTAIGQEVEIDNIVVNEAPIISITAMLGTKSVTSTTATLSIKAGTFTKFVLNFEATASEENADLKLWLSGAGNVFVDKLSLTQAYDRIVIVESKSTINNGGYGGILHTYGSDVNPISDLYFTNNCLALQSRTKDGTNLVSSITSNILTLNTFYSITQIVDRTNNQQIIVNGTSRISSATTNLGKMIFAYATVIGGRGAGDLLLNGQISHLQIIRFENISQSTFNSALTGLQYPTGGGAEEVLRLTFQDGSSIVNCLKDYSPKGHTVSGVLVDITNRKRVTA